jgi:glycosyltransferase involved in cell wall biosynthesis
VHRELPLAELTRLIAGSAIVILPLQERDISIGQSVLLQAMAMAKPVVVTRVNGTVDYIEDMKTGVFVPPRDAESIRQAVRTLADDAGLRARIGSEARSRIEQAHLLTHYLQGVSNALAERFGGR